MNHQIKVGTRFTMKHSNSGKIYAISGEHEDIDDLWYCMTESDFLDEDRSKQPNIYTVRASEMAMVR